jgi:hypothetical protein
MVEEPMPSMIAYEHCLATLSSITSLNASSRCLLDMQQQAYRRDTSACSQNAAQARHSNGVHVCVPGRCRSSPPLHAMVSEV